MTVMDATYADAKEMQRRDALEVANRIRFFRADMKRQLRSGEMGLRDVQALILAERPHGLLESMRVADLLRAVPSFGAVKVSRVLRASNVPMSFSLVRLTVRQREALADELERYAERDR